LVFYGILFSKLVDKPLANMLGIENPDSMIILLLNTITSTIIVLIFGEYVPKNLFGLNSVRTLKILSVPFQFINWLLFVPVYLVVKLTRQFLRLVVSKSDAQEDTVFTKVDLNDFVKRSVFNMEEDEEIDTTMFEKALELPDIKVRECMIPRNEIVAVEEGYEIEELKEIFVNSGYSKILIYKDSPENFVAYTHHLDILKNRKKQYDLLVLPETMTADMALNEIIKERKSLAIVVDEFGGTAGMITVEDILEEIFGEIHDEYDDTEELLENQISERTYQFSARWEIDDLNEKYNFSLPEGDYETLSGMLLHHLESIPQINEEVFIGNYVFRVVEAEESKLKTVEITDLNEEEENNA